MEFKLIAVEGNMQKLDGGAMYGNCPKALWEKWSPADPLNRIDLGCRALLVQEKRGRNILCETGIGYFFPEKLRNRYGVQGTGHVLLENLGRIGLAPEDIDAIVLSHLHFDHAGGLLTEYKEGKRHQLAFPRAKFIVGREALERAKNPHPRDRASFIPEIQELLEASGRLEVVDSDRSAFLGPGYRFSKSNGHTPGMIHISMDTPAGPLLFAGDLAPGLPWVHLPITMGYDRNPELLVNEKKKAFEELVSKNGILFFTHDPKTSIARIRKTDKGKFEGIPLDIEEIS